MLVGALLHYLFPTKIRIPLILHQLAEGSREREIERRGLLHVEI